MEKKTMFGPIKTMVDVYRQNQPLYADCDNEGSGDPDCDCDAVDGS
jgi:hypothetical protein